MSDFVTVCSARAAEQCEIVPRTTVVQDRDWIVKQKVVGSNPTPATKLGRHVSGLAVFIFQRRVAS